MSWNPRSRRPYLAGLAVSAAFALLLAAAALVSSPASAAARALDSDSLDPLFPQHSAVKLAPSVIVPVQAPQPVAAAPLLPVPQSAAAVPLVPAPRPEPSSRGGSRSSNPDLSTPDKFIAVVGEAAQDSQRNTGVPASVTIAQAILESEWGRSALAKKAFNFFGIKAAKGPGPAGVIKMDTWEVLSGANVVVKDAFRAYNNVFESIEDHGHFLCDNSRYAPAFKATNDPKEFARRIQAAGYATDPAYSTKLINLMDKYNLYKFDLPIP